MTGTSSAPSVASCLLLMTAVDASSRLLGLRRTLRWTRRVAIPVSGSVDADLCARRVSLAAAFYPRRALCLEQALVLFVMLRRRGADAELRVGVQPRPFYAHAWVEVAGRPLHEARDLTNTFASFATLEV